MKVYVIIVTYNAEQWLDKCINSLLNSTIPVHIVVVDNKSTDHTVALIKSNYPEVLLIETNSNLGFGKANNVGIKYAVENKGDYVFLLNQDAWVDNIVIESLINIHSKNKQYGIVSPMHLNGKGTALDYNFSQVCNINDCPGLFSDVYLNSKKEIYTIKFVMAAIWLIPIEVIKKVGLFDPIFPHYGEDGDYVNRLIYHGFKVGVCPAYTGFHDREERASSPKRNRIIRKLSNLSNLKNNNQSFTKVFLHFIFSWFKNIIKLFLEFNFTGLFNEFSDGFNIIYMIPQILKNRKYCVKESAFLNTKFQQSGVR